MADAMPADGLLPSTEASATRLAVVAVVVLGAIPLVAAGAPALLPGSQDLTQAQTQQQQDQQSTPLEVDPERADRTVRPGNSTTITVTLDNDGDSAVALQPSVVELEEALETVPAEWVTVEAPETVAAGESVEATVTVDAPADGVRPLGRVRARRSDGRRDDDPRRRRREHRRRTGAGRSRGRLRARAL